VKRFEDLGNGDMTVSRGHVHRCAPEVIADIDERGVCAQKRAKRAKVVVLSESGAVKDSLSGALGRVFIMLAVSLHFFYPQKKTHSFMKSVSTAGNDRRDGSR
jgi:hypothetical protein